MRSIGKKLLAMTLTLAILISTVPAQVFAYMAPKSENLSVVDKNGKTIAEDDSWETTFPYGAFAFEHASLANAEGEDGIIKVYRLGGTAGRATAFLTYEPVLTQSEDGTTIYDYAISSDDIEIKVEEPQPAAKYQPVGKVPDPKSSKATVKAAPDEKGYTLNLSVTAEQYQWQILNNGVWENILDATAATVPADKEFVDGSTYDYRCLYTEKGLQYCSSSMRGEVYVAPAEEVLEPMPDGINLSADPVYTPLDMKSAAEGPFAGWAFELIFADGEWVKEIHLSSLLDALPEAQEAATFTIRDCEGGQVLESANTLLMSIRDINEPEPSTLGFAVSAVTVDKADGTAEVMIERVGGSQRPVTVEYTTQDGTALAGTDYASASGKLMFYGGLRQLPVKVSLIDDGIPTTEPKQFDIVLSQILGDDGCTLSQGTVRVDLINSAKAVAPNLATQLYDPQAVDVSDNVPEAEGAANQNSGPAEGVQVPLEEPESVYSQLDFGGGDGEISPMVYGPSLATIKFKNPTNAWDGATDAANRDYWKMDNEAVVAPAMSALYRQNETAKDVGYDWNWTSDEFIDRGVALVSTTENGARITDEGWNKMGGGRDIAGQMYRGYNVMIKTRQGHDTSRSVGGHYYYSYTRPRLHFDQGSNGLVSNPRYINRFGTSAFDNYWTIRAADVTQPVPIQERFSNPFEGTYKNDNAFGFKGPLNLYMTMHYESNNEYERDVQNTSSMVWLRMASLYRRSFAADAFKVEITTPNDSNTAPDGCAILSQKNYEFFKPKVEMVAGQGGVTKNNQVYVGSTIKISIGDPPPGYQAGPNLMVYQSTDGGRSWNKFGKFKPDYNTTEKFFTIKLVGSAADNLEAGDLNAQYKFRLAYDRASEVHVDFMTSVPKKEGDDTAIDLNKIMEPVTGYLPAKDGDHAFNKNVTAHITYGESVFDTNSGDYSKTCSEKTLAKPTAQKSLKDTVWTFDAVNIQWVNFNLSPKDLLLVNGNPYPGNAKIYLKASDFAGGMSVLYYHEDYLTALSAMKTTISWMGVYWDANGNGKIDGHYDNTDVGAFVLDANADEFSGYIKPGTNNETMFAPKKNADGNYCQYFIKVCYTMIPRSLRVPIDAKDSERAQILPAFTTAVNADSAAYSKLTPEQRAYRYLVSGLTKQSSTATEDTRSSDNHLKYGENAGKKSTLDIPLGGDFSPATLKEGATAYTWSPVFRGNILYPFAAPDPITIDNSLAGPTKVTGDYSIARDAEGIVTGYTYTKEGLDRMNGYLSSFTGTTAFAMVTQEQKKTTKEILEAMRPGVTLGGGAAASDDVLYVQTVEEYAVRPDSVTLGNYSTTPDAEYLKEIESSTGPSSEMGMDGSGSEMSEFNTDLGMNLGSTSLPVTDYVSILLDATKVGFSLSLPLGEFGPKKGEGQDFVEKNKGNWTQFNDFFKKGNFGGDESYEKASKEKTRRKNAPSAAPSVRPSSSTPSSAPSTPPSGAPSEADKNGEFKSKSFSVSFVVGLAFLFEYNSLDNGYYFEGMTISITAALTFRIQARLTICPIVYFYFQFDGSIELSSGLGVIRDSVEVTPALLDGKSPNMQGNQKKLTYMTRPSAGAVLTAEKYNALETEPKKAYSKDDPSGNYYKTSYGTYAAARSAHLETGDYFLTKEQYALLTEAEKADYTWSTDGSTGHYYNKKNYAGYNAAATAYNKAAVYEFETNYKAFNIRFSGKIAVDVYTKDGDKWKPANENSGYITGFLSSEGDGDTRVVLKKQDGMMLKDKQGNDETVKVVIRPLDYDEKVQKDVTTILYIAQIKDVRNEVYWKGIRIAPSVAIEVGAGIGVELMKVELYAKVGLEATFTLGVYNRAYDPYDADPNNNDKYLPVEVEQFGFSIGIGLRVVLLCFTFELDAATYCVDYSRNSLSKGEWTTGWHFLNDWVAAEDASESGYLGVTIKPPRSAADRQKLYAPQDNAVPEFSTQAYDPTDKTVPFQLSGFGKNVDAANLNTGILPGSDYKVVSAGGRNFIVYTISRSGTPAPEDTTQLVMSELTRVNTAAEGETPVFKYGLANPNSTVTDSLYIVLDADATGDLDFDLWAEESKDSSNVTTHTIHSAWVSYASEAPAESAPTPPVGKVYTVGGVEMTADNYTTILAPSVPDEPKEPTAPTPPTEVVESTFYTTAVITKEDFDKLGDPEKALCEGIGDKITGTEGYATYTQYTPVDKKLTTVADVKKALADAQAKYTKDKATYDTDLIKYNADNAAYPGLKDTYDKAVLAKASYTAWHDYYISLSSYNASAQVRVKTAARNTVLKSAAWKYTSTSTPSGGENPTITIQNDAAFTPPAVLGGDDNKTATDLTGYVFAPASNGDGSAVFFGSTNAQDTGDVAYTAFHDNLVATRPVVDQKTAYEDYLASMKKSNLDVFGTQSSLNLAYKKTDGKWAVSSTPLTEGQTLANVEFTKLNDGKYYVAYTTQQDIYEGSGATADHITVTRLALRTAEIKNDAVTWSDAYLLRMTRDYDRFSTKDGIYGTDNALKEAHDAPYFSNLSFLTAGLDETKLTGVEEDFTTMAVTNHTFLLFEMNGATYVILDKDLKTIVGSTHKGTIHPFFKGATQTSADGKTTKEEASGKLEVTIGTDKKGGIFAVYVGSVPNTTNNALYRSAYDPVTNTWGDGVMLAMRHMDTYEASIRNAWGKRTTQAAYWGLAGTTKPNGLLTDLDIEHLFKKDFVAGDITADDAPSDAPKDTTKDDILENLKAFPNDLGDKKNLVFSNVQAIQGAGDELLVLTQATTTTLGISEYTKTVPAVGGDGTPVATTEYSVAPTASKADGMLSDLGMYAISYGGGKQQLGEGKLSFGQPDFSMGSKLYVNLSVVNTGDTAFRGSVNQPITATLEVGTQPIAKWDVTSNIRSGQTLAMDGDCLALISDLKDGDIFTLTLEEYKGAVGSDPAYQNPISRSIDLFTVEATSDLGVEDLKVSVAKVSDDGLTTTLNVDFIAGNRGSGPALDVYTQFTYADGKDENGAPTYAVLDLTGNTLTIDQEKPLETQTANESTEANLKNGILYLYNATDGNNDLKAGYGRKVRGTIQVPSTAFTAGEAGYLDLKLDLFTSADKIVSMDAGVRSAKSSEYYGGNNTQNSTVQASTSYTVAPSIVIPMGTTTLVPITAVSNRGVKPALSVTEINDTADGLNLGILNFKQSSVTGGKVAGTLSITPSTQGTGIIHVYDGNTESLVAVAFTVTDSANGIDIFNDNGSFQFKNADNTDYDAKKPNQSWSFVSAPTWGGTETDPNSQQEVPLRNNLSVGTKGSSFTFNTVAESIDLYFQGDVTVSSTFPSDQPKNLSNAIGGKTPQNIKFGENPENAAFSVTVRVASVEARFDRMAEHYSGGTVPTPSYDGESPVFIWSRSFPATASINSTSPTPIPLSLYVLDNAGIDYLEVDGTRYTAADTGKIANLDGTGLLWCYDFTPLTANKNYELKAVDTAGNIVSTTLQVDWFHASPSAVEGTVEVPLYNADFYLDDAKWDKTTAIGKNDVDKLNIQFTADANNTKAAGNTHELFYFDGKEIKSQGKVAVGEKKSIAQNGIYQTLTSNSDKTWSSQVMYMGKMDASLPQVYLGFDAATGLSWRAYKPVTAATAISHADINGYTVSSTTGKNLNGVLPIQCGGKYTLTVQDEGGNSATISNTVSARPIRLDADTCSFIPTAAWNQAKNNGSLAVNLTGITGGTYNEADSTKATNTYHARYELTLVPGDYDFAKLGTDSTRTWTTIKQGSPFTHDYPNLAVGEYKVVVRDEADKNVYSSVPVTVADSAMTASGATINASLPTAKDGQLMASAKGGNTKGFEFSIVPMKKVDETKQYTIAEFKTAAGKDPLKWSLGDNIALSARSNTFTGLEKGWYLAAVRGLYGVTDSEFASLVALRETQATAEHALASALTPTADELKALQKAVTDAQAAYDLAAKPLQDQSAAAYTGTPGYWDGAIVIALEVDADPAPVSGEPAPKKSNLGKLSSDGNGSAVYTLKSASGKLSPSDNKALLAANQENDLVLQGNGLSVFIPKGTLTKGFDVNRLIIDPTTAKSGKILQYTDESGQKTLIPWCLVSDGALKYMVSGLGDYALVDCAAPFADIAGLWGADAIAFMADRGILTGTGKNLFSPYLPMNRAMFVTALWRTAGKPAPKGQPSFSDLDGDWYRAAVQWAVESGITKGCGNNLFGSNLEVSREQMCAFLCRFLTYMGMELDLAPEDPTFKDAENISTWAKDAVAQCAKAGLVQGVGHDAFAPTNSASRMEVSTLLTRFITALVEKYCGK